MTVAKKHLGALAFGLAVAALASPTYAQAPGTEMSSARASAIHQCSVLADRYPLYDWGNTQIYQYRACMAEHGQQE